MAHDQSFPINVSLSLRFNSVFCFRGERSSAILLTTHSMEEAETLSSRIAIMTKGGNIVCQGSTGQIKSDHGKSFNVDLTFRDEEKRFELSACD